MEQELKTLNPWAPLVQSNFDLVSLPAHLNVGFPFCFIVYHLCC